MQRGLGWLLLSLLLLLPACQLQAVDNPGTAPRAGSVLPPSPAAATPPGTLPAAPVGTPIPPPPAGASPLPLNGWTAGIVRKEASVAATATVSALRLGQHSGFDRVVLEFAGNHVPGYHIEYIDKPVRACGSGDVVPLPGDAWLAIRLFDTQAHTETGAATLTQRIWERDGLIRQVRLTCDFEGEVVLVLGLTSPNRYRVTSLETPARLVIDVRH